MSGLWSPSHCPAPQQSLLRPVSRLQPPDRSTPKEHLQRSRPGASMLDRAESAPALPTSPQKGPECACVRACGCREKALCWPVPAGPCSSLGRAPGLNLRGPVAPALHAHPTGRQAGAQLGPHKVNKDGRHLLPLPARGRRPLVRKGWAPPSGQRPRPAGLLAQRAHTGTRCLQARDKHLTNRTAQASANLESSRDRKYPRAGRGGLSARKTSGHVGIL